MMRCGLRRVERVMRMMFIPWRWFGMFSIRGVGSGMNILLVVVLWDWGLMMLLRWRRMCCISLRWISIWVEVGLWSVCLGGWDGFDGLLCRLWCWVWRVFSGGRVGCDGNSGYWVSRAMKRIYELGWRWVSSIWMGFIVDWLSFPSNTYQYLILNCPQQTGKQRDTRSLK